MIVVSKNAREELRVTIEPHPTSGRPLLRIWEFFQGRDGDMRPGKRGLAIRADLAEPLVEAIRAEIARNEG
ncbi:Transcriptional Coactivator p15 (PC4) [Roseivivax halotolerans]|uniref:Transcriptional Coactivator p15 (PC4) n=1 Tax=Roseivivax halotolerans TaxID=93684 RepID=A0A1I5ZHV5_9RHOB|nr:transcriptional coactivator p15/PC4 family protein [Roseivivax halotolerans]SFQ55717.1 Transcriptional Coactivator p15 (PC4) [Roseivivax halotolerans]